MLFRSLRAGTALAWDAGQSRVLLAQVDAGVLVIEDCEVGATQFIAALTATTFKPMLFNFDAPTEQRIAYVVKIAVRAFIAAYGKK